MEFEVSYSLENEQQFWDELNDIVSASAPSHELIDNALRNYLSFTARFKEEYLQSEYDVARCSYQLLQSVLFKSHQDYVRRQIVYELLEAEEACTIHLLAAFLLFDGKTNEATFEMMQEEGSFPRLVHLVQDEVTQRDPQLHRLLLDLIYEMSRMQRLRLEDLLTVGDAFILYLFHIIEEVSDDANDRYHYPIIRVLLVLNEQYMVASTTVPTDKDATPLTNRVIKALGTHGIAYNTFGRNIILLLNRETETSLQLLILKLLYLLFQNSNTAEYFYTNDLHVLIDVILRNLLDLPVDSPPAIALRHTYLRVLHPLLANSQIKRPPHYKRDDVLNILRLLTQSGNHFAPVDETTVRLVNRCIAVSWLDPPSKSVDESPKDEPKPDIIPVTAKLTVPPPARKNGISPPVPAPRRSKHNIKLQTAARMASGQRSERGSISSVAGEPISESPDEESRNAQKELARKMLGMNLDGSSESAVSIVEVAAQKEKPGVQTPSRSNVQKV